MSIDFTKVVGVRDDKGVLSQITDAAGRVLWSAVPAFDGTIILRPSADISVDSTITLTPADATAAYLLINEDVCDGAATSIKAIGGASGTAVFGLAGEIPIQIAKVNNIYLVACGYREGGIRLASSTVWLTCGTAEYYMDITTPMINATDYEPCEGFVYTKHDLTSDAYTSVTTEEMCADINTYISANGALPIMELHIKLSSIEDDDDPKTTGTFEISQIYAVIECE